MSVFAILLFAINTAYTQANPHMIKGVCWVGGDSIIDCNLDPLVDNHVNWISQTPFAWMQNHDTPKINYGPDADGWGGSEIGLVHTAELAHDKGIKVILKPHIWIMDGKGKWRSDIEMHSKQEWDQWFSDYRDFILHFAKIAEKGKMEALCIGTELLIPSTRFPDRWLHIIEEIRKVYSGNLTYAANFYKEYEGITFWGALDAIGIQGYFPISTDHNPSKSDLLKAWAPHISRMEAVHRKYGKPIIFTEIGYKNTSDAAIEPWTWPRHDGHDFIESQETQAICLDAMFESLWHQDWFDGVFIWKWFHTDYRHASEPYDEYLLRMQNLRKSNGEKVRRNISFSPQGKLAMETLRQWFSKY